MPRNSKILLVLAAFLTVLATAGQGALAYTDPCAGNQANGNYGAANTPDPSNNNAPTPEPAPGTWEYDLFTADLLTEQGVDQAALNASAQFKPIDVQNNYGLGCLTNIWNTLQTAYGVFNSATPFGVNLWSAVSTKIIQEIANEVLAQVCSSIQGVISPLEQAAQQNMQLCLPLPTFHIPQFTFALPHLPCNGVPVVGAGLSIQTGPQSGQPPFWGLSIGQ